MLIAIFTIVVAYFIGAIPFGYLVARMRGVNIFAHGSGNIGATNVGRVLGRRFGVLVFGLDFAKGATPVALAMLMKPHFAGELWASGCVEVAAGLTAFLGHLFPIYLKFHGGKGVATGAGAVFVLVPIPALAALGVWLVVVSASRYVSLASIAAVVVLCAAHLCRPAAWSWHEPRTWFCLIAGGLTLARHSSNIVRLLRGTENQLKENVMMHQLRKSLHVLALGLWFGMSVFFSFVVALSLFHSFEALALRDQPETWFPRPALYGETVEDSKEQGTRAAGFAVGPMFVWYFALQGVCGFIALATALPLLKLPGRVHRWRVNLLLVAIGLVLVGWPIEQHVSDLRLPRNEATEAYLANRNDDTKAAMTAARTDFGRWHLGSLALNLATIVCVTAAMALAANQESAATPAAKPPEEASGDEPTIREPIEPLR